MKKTTEKIPDAGPAAPEVAGPEPDAASAAEIARLSAENAALRDAVRLGSARETVTAGLAAAGARSPLLLFEHVRGDLQFADDGSLQNAEAVVGLMRQRFPEQFGPASPPSIDAGAGRAAAVPLTKEALAKMTPAEVASLNWDDVRSVLSGR